MYILMFLMYKEGAKLQKSVRPALAQSNRNCHLDPPPLGGSQPTSTHARPRLFTAHFTELAHNPSPPVPALGCSTQRPPPTLCTAEAVGAHPQLSHTAALRCSQQATLTISRATARSPAVSAMGASALASRRAHPLRAVACRLADVRRCPERSRLYTRRQSHGVHPPCQGRYALAARRTLRVRRIVPRHQLRRVGPSAHAARRAPARQRALVQM